MTAARLSALLWLPFVRGITRTVGQMTHATRQIAEGRFDTPELAAEALARGAHAVVVGTMITNPREITRRFVAALGPGA